VGSVRVTDHDTMQQAQKPPCYKGVKMNNDKGGAPRVGQRGPHWGIPISASGRTQVGVTTPNTRDVCCLEGGPGTGARCAPGRP
jgi:hypothetical protein